MRTSLVINSHWSPLINNGQLWNDQLLSNRWRDRQLKTGERRHVTTPWTGRDKRGCCVYVVRVAGTADLNASDRAAASSRESGHFRVHQESRTATRECIRNARRV
jgi:hypothetical protein